MNSFVVSPMTQKIYLTPGETYQGEIIVANPLASTMDFSYKAVLRPYSVDRNYNADLETITDWSNIVSWTSLRNTEGTLKPNESAKVKYTIRVPDTAPGGGQYMVIGISSNEEITASSGASIQNSYEMGSIVYAEIAGETTHEGKIVENSATGFVATGAPSVKLVFTNDGNVHEAATVSLSVKNKISGDMIVPNDENDGEISVVVMPDTTRELVREIEGVDTLGIYEVSQKTEYMGETSEMTTTLVMCPLWFIALIFITIMMFVLTISWSVHKRRKSYKKHLHFEDDNAKIDS